MAQRHGWPATSWILTGGGFITADRRGPQYVLPHRRAGDDHENHNLRQRGLSGASNPMVRSEPDRQPFHDMAEDGKARRERRGTGTSTSSAPSRGTISRRTRRPASWWTTSTGFTWRSAPRW
ncbi:MAG: hypothetical protein ACLVL7_05820 [Anaerotruncus massiliensis (ex Togo et al. 2019)]